MARAIRRSLKAAYVTFGQPQRDSVRFRTITVGYRPAADYCFARLQQAVAPGGRFTIPVCSVVLLNDLSIDSRSQPMQSDVSHYRGLVEAR